MTHRMSERIAPWIEKAVESQSAGDSVLWEMALHQIPNGGFGLALILTMPGAVIGSVIHSVSIIGHPAGLTEVEANDMVRQMIENLRTQRSKQLADINGGGIVNDLLPPHPGAAG